VTWVLYFTRQARKDARKLAASGMKEKAQELLDIIREDSFQKPPPYEILLGDLAGACSRRINIQHRLVYQVLKDERSVKVLRLWTHYE
jgi:Txe/YoeB family toxin of toxin-antitoxin system